MTSHDSESTSLARQIAELQAKHEAALQKELKRKRENEERRERLLVEQSPAKKRPAQSIVRELSPPKRPVFSIPKLVAPPPGPSQPPKRSTLSAALTHSNRSTPLDDDDEMNKRKWRDEVDLTVIENLRLGVKDFGADHSGSLEWKSAEPNSGINLKERLMPHDEVQSQLDNRYTITPSQIYSLIRPATDKRHYEMPLDFGWAVIGVVCYKGPIKVMKTVRHMNTADGRRTRDGDDGSDGMGDSDMEEQRGSKRRKVADEEDGSGKPEKEGDKKRIDKVATMKKFMTIRICSLPSKAQLASDSVANGDAVLNLLLFEADTEETMRRGEGNGKRVYKGGSGGAFEKWSKLAVGAVVGVVNPKILKPYGSGKEQPHPLIHPVGLTPTSQDDIFLIGRARDIGTCVATKKDGNQCTSWVDVRINPYCDYHVHLAVKGARKERAEFASSTSGFDLAQRARFNPNYNFNGKGGKLGVDPEEKMGRCKGGGQVIGARNLQGGEQTYIVGGMAISEKKAKNYTDFADQLTQQKKSSQSARKQAATAKEYELGALLASDLGNSTGAKYLEAANRLNRERLAGNDGAAELKRVAEKNGLEDELKARPFNPQAIKLLGFDPTLAGSPGGLIVEQGEEGRKRLEAIASLRRRNRTAPKLGNMAGIKTKSNAINPTKPTAAPEEPMIDLDDSDDD